MKSPSLNRSSLSAVANKANGCGEPSATERQRALTWAQRLKRVFAIDIEVCRRCGGRLRVIASLEDSAVIERILEHLGRERESVDPHPRPRASPLTSGPLRACAAHRRQNRGALNFLSAELRSAEFVSLMMFPPVMSAAGSMSRARLPDHTPDDR